MKIFTACIFVDLTAYLTIPQFASNHYAQTFSRGLGAKPDGSVILCHVLMHVLLILL